MGEKLVCLCRFVHIATVCLEYKKEIRKNLPF